MSKEQLDDLPDELKEHIKTEDQLIEYIRATSRMTAEIAHQSVLKEIEFHSYKNGFVAMNIYMTVVARVISHLFYFLLEIKEHKGITNFIENLENITSRAREKIKNETNNNNKKESTKTEV